MFSIRLVIYTTTIFLTGCFEPPGRWNVDTNCIRNIVGDFAARTSQDRYINGFRLKTQFTQSRFGKNRVIDYSFTDNVGDTNYFSGEQYYEDSDSLGYQRFGNSVDNTGRPIGGGESSGLSIFTSSSGYAMIYDELGQLKFYDVTDGSGDLRHVEFSYENGRLVKAVSSISVEGRADITISYSYDEQSHLTAQTESIENRTLEDYSVINYYTCNDANQVTTVYHERKLRKIGYSEIDYDENGNLTSLIEYDDDGQWKSTETYEYVRTNQVVFNHWLYRFEVLPWGMSGFVE